MFPFSKPCWFSVCRYQRCAEADHIKRDVDAYTAERNKIEEQRKAVAEIQYCKENNLPIPPHLLPKPKKKVGADEGLRRTGRLLSTLEFLD